MKNKLLLLASAFAITFGQLTMVSCGNNDSPSSSESKEDEKDNEKDEGEGSGLTPLEQKQYLEKTGLELVNHLQAEEIQNLSDIGVYFMEHYVYSRQYDTDALDDHITDVVKNLTTSIGDERSGHYLYHLYKVIYSATAFNGHYNAGATGWEYTPAEDLRITFKGNANKDYIVKISTSGEAGTVYITDYKYNYGYYQDEAYRDYIYLTLPKHAEVTFTENGKTLVNILLNASISGLINDKVDLASSRVDVNGTINFNNYEIQIDKATAQSGNESEIKMQMNHVGEMLISSQIKATATIHGNHTMIDKDTDIADWENQSAKSISVSLNILNKVQLRGSLKDAVKLAMKLEKANANYTNELDFKAYINDANDLMDIGIYYDNENEHQASVKLMAFSEKSPYSGRVYWEAVPVVSFADGSTYSIEVFFDESDFRDLIHAAEALVDDYEREASKLD